jgi:hypothetical protein
LSYADARRVDDVAGALLWHREQNGARDIEQAENTSALEIFDFLRGSLLDGAEETIAGVFHKNVDTPKMLERRVDGGLDLRFVGYIQSKLLPYKRARRLGFLEASFSLGLRLRTLAGRILRIAALPARWQARHMYQLATVR